MSQLEGDKPTTVSSNQYKMNIDLDYCPDFLEHIEKVGLFSGLTNFLLMYSITIEFNAFFLGSDDDDWTIDFIYVAGGTHFGIHMRVTTVGSSVQIRRTTEFSVINHDAKRITTYEFSGDTGQEWKTMSSSLNPLEPDGTGSSATQDKEIAFHVDLAAAPMPKILFDTKEHTWYCRCWTGDNKWCEHIDDWLRAGGDRAVLADWWGRADKISPLRYPIARGLVFVDLQLQSFAEKDILGEGDGHVHRLLFDEDSYIWVDETTNGMMLVDQVIERVKAWRGFQDWFDRAMTGQFPIGTKCRNKRHSTADSKYFKNMCNMLDDVVGGRYELAIANAYRDLFDDCCLSCWQVKQNMAQDIPRI